MDSVFYEAGEVVRYGVVDDVEGEPFKARSEMGISDGSGPFQGRTSDEADRDNWKRVSSYSPLKVMLSCGELVKGVSRDTKMNETIERPVLLKAPQQVIIVEMSGVINRGSGNQQSFVRIRGVTHTVAGEIPANN